MIPRLTHLGVKSSESQNLALVTVAGTEMAGGTQLAMALLLLLHFVCLVFESTFAAHNDDFLHGELAHVQSTALLSERVPPSSPWFPSIRRRSLSASCPLSFILALCW